MTTAPRARGRPPLLGRLDPPADRYLRACLGTLAGTPGVDLVGAYLYGSSVIGEFQRGRSDVDLVAVVGQPLPAGTAEALTERILAVPAGSAKGLDLAVVTAAAAGVRSDSPRYELELLTFYAKPKIPAPDAADEVGDPRLVMNFACCRDHGIALTGPPAVHVFAPVDRDRYLAVLRAELDLRHMPAHYLVLNACRDWRFAEEGLICSKVEGGRWARDRVADRWLVDAALQWQTESAGPVLDQLVVRQFLDATAQRLGGSW
ncbi:MAG TPA: aminoglycoside adenylyltransferase domain-containing protein [Propionibacteriaceae bacterium]|nr:aminoglycoside adenylyltransferase domain-containing protein [Propionibacteriaceae bacterium]